MIRRKKKFFTFHSFPLLLILVIPFVTFAQDAQTNSKMKQQQFTEAKELNIVPSSTSSPNDFDFLEGRWKVHNRKLNERLNNSQSWSEFESTLHMRKTLHGTGNVENFYASFDGKPFEGMAVRLFNPATKLWTIYWIDTNNAVMDQHPVSGSFENGLGKFYAKDVFKGKEITVLYQWDARNPAQPKWAQAFSLDGETWEWNWEMVLKKTE